MKLGIVFSLLMIAQVALADFQGDDSCAYGTHGCNRCVENVEQTFLQDLPTKRKYRNKFRTKVRSKPKNEVKRPKFHLFKDHIQGLGRVPGLGDENWFALTMSGNMGESGFFLVKMNKFKSDGEALKKKGFFKRRSKYHYYHRFEGTNHAGGIQLQGTLMATGIECARKKKCNAWVEFTDLSNPKKPKKVSQIVLDGSYGELVDDKGEALPSKAASVAFTRLVDGRYLVFIAGNQSGKYGWFFVSKSDKLSMETEWEYLDYWHNKENARSPIRWFWQGQDNVNFITECGTKRIYMLGLGRFSNTAVLYQIKSTPSNNFSFRYVHKKRFNSTFFTTMRHGSNVHITPSGKLVFYLSSRWGRRINEFAK